ncbi:MarR family winged helix-turn-helix transcriptional regulator [Cytobacillus oceanisediminis]|uniref:MarR family winged helix-turn-helix transcriptional regulator n=1 Tax=Cytobacillus oceanisediminis TaxID=665099 RepID=UPI0037363351
MKNKADLLNQYWTDIYFHLHYIHTDKITHQAIRIMQLIDKQGNIGVSGIASFLNVSHNTASEHVKRLENKQFIIKKRDPADERKAFICLTGRGKEVLDRNTSLDQEKLKQVLNELDEKEQCAIEQALKILSERAKQCKF